MLYGKMSIKPSGSNDLECGRKSASWEARDWKYEAQESKKERLVPLLLC